MAEQITEKLASTNLETNSNSAPVSQESHNQESAAVPSAQAPDVSADDVALRALVSSRYAGIIIGRGGQAIAEVRSQSGVKAGISKTVAGVSDRILSVSGSPENISKVCLPVVKDSVPHLLDSQALLMISSTLADSLAADLQPGSPALSLNLLIPHAAMGALIGKAGARIKEIQDNSGSRMVAHKDMLPQSTERIVEISGPPDAVAAAAKFVTETLQNEADKLHGSVLFNPAAIGPDGPGAQFGAAPPLYGNASVMGGFQAPAGRARGGRGGRVASFGTRNVSTGTHMPLASFGAPAPAQSFPVPPPVMSAPDPTQNPPALFDPEDSSLRTQTISFPADMIGCIIGKGGSRISEIRRQSGSRISIARDSNPSGERLFSIMGSIESYVFDTD